MTISIFEVKDAAKRTALEQEYKLAIAANKRLAESAEVTQKHLEQVISDNVALTEENKQLSEDLSAANRRNEELTRSLLTESQRDLLNNYCNHPITAKELAAIRRESRHNAGGKLKDLYDKGLLSREIKVQPKGSSAYEYVYSIVK